MAEVDVSGPKRASREEDVGSEGAEAEPDGCEVEVEEEAEGLRAKYACASADERGTIFSWL